MPQAETHDDVGRCGEMRRCTTFQDPTNYRVVPVTKKSRASSPGGREFVILTDAGRSSGGGHSPQVTPSPY